MADKKYIVFLTEAIHPSKRQTLAEAAAPGLHVPVNKVVSLISRPVGPLTRPSTQTEASRIMRVLHNAGIPVEVRNTAQSHIQSNQSAASTASQTPARTPQNPLQNNPISGQSPTTHTGLGNQNIGSGGQNSSSLPNFQSMSVNDNEVGRTMFDVPATPATSAPPFPTQPATAHDNFNEQDIVRDAQQQAAQASTSFSNNFNNEFSDNFGNDFRNDFNSTPNNVSNNFKNDIDDDFSDVAFESDMDDFSDVDMGPPNSVQPIGGFDNTLDEDEHNRLVAEQEAAQARRIVGLGVKEKTRRRFRFPIAYKLILSVLLPLLAFAGVTYYVVNTRAISQAQTLLLQLGDNIAINLAEDISSFVAQEGVEINSDETSYHFTARLTQITQALSNTAGVHFTDAQGIYNSGSLETDVTQNAQFQEFQNDFGTLALRTLSLADFTDDETKRRQTLTQRTSKISTEQGNFYVVASPLANDGGTVQVIIAERNILESAGELINPILLAAAISLVFASLVAAIFAAALSRNIRRLASTAERIALGDLDEPVVLRGNDETRDLAEAFESMRESLQAAIERLSRRDRQNRR